jgi:MFS family permease
MNNQLLDTRKAILVFSAFGIAYFVSTLVRAVTATLSPALSIELNLQAHELGLLAGGFSLGFALVQIPMGGWLDRFGPKKVSMFLMMFAFLGCVGFALARNFYELWAARILTGVGVSACLMAPLTGGRRWLAPATQMRANSWLLMTGSLGMLMSTLPVQWVLPYLGWRFVFLCLSVILVFSLVMINIYVPPWEVQQETPDGGAKKLDFWASYLLVVKNPYFRKVVPVGFFGYGSLLAIQTLWAGPWLVQIDKFTPMEAARGLFFINLAMLFCFGAWGWAMPFLERRGFSVTRLMKMIYPFSLISLLWLTQSAQGQGVGILILFCLTSSVIAMIQPTVGLSFDRELAGKALCSFNLVIFLGIFVVQWGLGLLIDWGSSIGLSIDGSYRLAFIIDLCCCAVSYAYFLLPKGDNLKPEFKESHAK